MKIHDAEILEYHPLSGEFEVLGLVPKDLAFNIVDLLEFTRSLRKPFIHQS